MRFTTHRAASLGKAEMRFTTQRAASLGDGAISYRLRLYTTATVFGCMACCSLAEKLSAANLSWLTQCKRYIFDCMYFFHSKLQVILANFDTQIFVMHLDKHYIQMHDKNYASRLAKMTYNLKRRVQQSHLLPSSKSTPTASYQNQFAHCSLLFAWLENQETTESGPLFTSSFGQS